MRSNFPSSPFYGVCISALIQYARVCSSCECFNLRTTRFLNKRLEQGYVKERLSSSLRKFYGRYGDLFKQYEFPLSWRLKKFFSLTIYNDNPPLIRLHTVVTVWQNSNFHRIWRGFNTPFATNMTCRLGKQSPPDTWPRPILDLHMLYLLRPIFLQTCDFSGRCTSIIPRYFLEFAAYFLHLQ